MKPWLTRALLGATLLAAGVLILALVGLIPSSEPGPVETEAFDPRKAVSETSPLVKADSAPSKPKQKSSLQGSWLPLCDAPEAGARLQRLKLFASSDTLLVWCKQGYQLFTVRADGGALYATRLARFKSRGELPGGAASGDFDGDGQQDLALGVATRPGVVHRAGAGVFWIRGRVQGGFEPARPLVEASTVALASYERVGAQRSELVVLTSGDVAAQRPGELWLFGLQPALVRQRVVPAALDPRGLVLRAGSDANALEAWVVAGQPGRVLRVVFDLDKRDVRKELELALALRGAQGFAHEPAFEGALFVRDAVSVYSVQIGAEPALVPYAERANVGPFVVRDFDGDLKPDVLAAMENGVVHIPKQGAEPNERELSGELKVHDVESLTTSVGEPLVLVLVTGSLDASSLSLLLLPKPPFAKGQELVLSRGQLSEAEGLAELALE